MQFTFTTDNPADAETILRALANQSKRDEPAERRQEPRREQSRRDSDDSRESHPSNEVDPWADEDRERRSEPRREARDDSEGDRKEPKIPRSGTYTVDTDNGSRDWTFGKSDAPTCECGLPAAYVEGTTNGNTWARWTCALKYSRDTYKGACDLNEFASKKKGRR